MKMKNITLLATVLTLMGTAGSAMAFGFDTPTQMGLVSSLVLGLNACGLLTATAASSFGAVAAACDTGPEQVLQEIQKVSQQFKSVNDDLVKVKSTLDEQLTKGGKLTDDLRRDFDARMTDFNNLKSRLDELEQKGVESTKQLSSQKSWGQQLVEHEGFEGFSKSAESGRTSFRAQIKATVTTTLAGGTGGLMNPAYQDGDLVRMPRTELTIENLLTVIEVDSGSIDFARQKTRNNAAAPVAEAAAKPYSDYSWESATVPVRTLAHLTKLTRQALDDAKRLVGEVDSEMRYGLGLIKEQQYLYGNNTGQNLHGIMPQATAFALPTGVTAGAVALANRVDVLRMAMLNLQLAGAPVDGMVLNPVDWALIELTKDANGGYAFSRPDAGLQNPGMWGKPIIATPAMLTDDFLVGAFKTGATAYRRMGVEVLISTENDKDFEQNLATMRAEERIALAVKRAWAFQKGKFSTATGMLTGTP